jgi:hypothetical protein
MYMRRIAGLAVAGWCFAVLAGCTSSEVLVAHSVPLAPTAKDIPESQLLDVAVKVFDPGVPEGEVDKDVLEHLIREGTFVQIRRAESIYMAVVLRDTLQKSGQWGTVWVTPKDTIAADLNVDAAILHSDGDVFALHAKAVDATGRVWLDKDYEMSTAAGAYNRQRYPDLDPYQDVFNEVSNDLAAARLRLSADETRTVRTVASLRYAEDLVPDAYAGYAQEDKRGNYTVNRLPATDDPTFERTQRIRQREHLFFETLDQHYDKFYQDAMTPYDGWRQYAREESIEIHELTKTAHWRTGMGVATILASIVYGSNSDNTFSDRVIRDAMMYVGMDMLKSSSLRRQEKRLHSQTLEELSQSFDDQAKPLVVDVQGVQHRLSGTADAQYQEWRDLLRQMFSAESGVAPEDVSVYDEPAPAPTPAQTAPADGQQQAAPTKDGATTEPASGATANVGSGD